jgi:hypothetical protein
LRISDFGLPTWDCELRYGDSRASDTGGACLRVVLMDATAIRKISSHAALKAAARSADIKPESTSSSTQ